MNPLTIKSKLMDFLKNKTSTTLKKSLVKTNNFNDLLMALVPVATREKIRKKKELFGMWITSQRYSTFFTFIKNGLGVSMKVDRYGTTGAHTIVKQHLDYGHWYCRNKLSLKDIHNCQYVTCMNPTAGSFTISQRLQRHFATYTVIIPSEEALFRKVRL